MTELNALLMTAAGYVVIGSLTLMMVALAVSACVSVIRHWKDL